MNPFVEEIVEKLISALREEYGEGAAAELQPPTVKRMVEQPPDPKMGDYAFPCHPLARIVRRPPNEIAERLAVRIEAAISGERIAEVKPVSGFLNFFVNREAFVRQILTEIFQAAHEGRAYGSENLGAGKTIVIDYSSPNIAKHLAVHHLWSTTIGNCLYRVLTMLGYKCVGINYLGDWGTQFGQLIVAFRRWGSEDTLKGDAVRKLNDLYVRFHREAEKNPKLHDEARNAFKQLESGDAECKALWRKFRKVSIEEFNRIYDLLGVKFDVTSGESEYSNKVGDKINDLVEMGLAKESEEALIVDLQQHDLPPCLLRKSDGATLYAARDICAAEHRWEKYRFHKMLYVVGSDQRLHFKQVFKVLELMGHDWARNCVHVDFGLVRFRERGEDKKMSTRRGEVVLLKDVLDKATELVEEIIRQPRQPAGQQPADGGHVPPAPKLTSDEEISAVARQVGVGAVIFAGLNKKRVKDVVFDWDDILNFKGDTGPYVQYTHARSCSILRKHGKPVPPSAPERVDFSILLDDYTFAVVKALERIPDAIRFAAEEYEPYAICGALLKLCSAFNLFLQHNRVLSDDAHIAEARILLTECVRSVIRTGLELLGVHAPERM